MWSDVMYINETGEEDIIRLSDVTEDDDGNISGVHIEDDCWREYITIPCENVLAVM